MYIFQYYIACGENYSICERGDIFLVKRKVLEEKLILNKLISKKNAFKTESSIIPSILVRLYIFKFFST